MSTECDSNEQRKCIETPVKTNICLVNCFRCLFLFEMLSRNKDSDYLFDVAFDACDI